MNPLGAAVYGWLLGIVMGTGTGLTRGKAEVHKKLKTLLDEGKLKVTDADGNEISSDQLMAILSEKQKKG